MAESDPLNILGMRNFGGLALPVAALGGGGSAAGTEATWPRGGALSPGLAEAVSPCPSSPPCPRPTAPQGNALTLQPTLLCPDPAPGTRCPCSSLPSGWLSPVGYPGGTEDRGHCGRPTGSLARPLGTPSQVSSTWGS